MKNSNQQYHIYITTNKRLTVLYTGITNNLIKRIFEHKNKVVKGFTSKYNADILVYYETYDSPLDAIRREKQIKGWTRKKKIELIKTINPKFQDLSSEWGELRDPSLRSG